MPHQVSKSWKVFYEICYKLCGLPVCNTNGISASWLYCRQILLVLCFVTFLGLVILENRLVFYDCRHHLFSLKHWWAIILQGFIFVWTFYIQPGIPTGHPMSFFSFSYVAKRYQQFPFIWNQGDEINSSRSCIGNVISSLVPPGRRGRSILVCL